MGTLIAMGIALRPVALVLVVIAAGLVAVMLVIALWAAITHRASGSIDDGLGNPWGNLE